MIWALTLLTACEEETGATVAEIANCYTIASAVFEFGDFWEKN